MSIANVAPRPALSAVLGRAGWAVVSLAAVGVALVSVPPYLLLDAAASRIPLDPAAASHVLWIAAHAVPGSLALLLGPIQVLPWARRRFPKVHRWVGRVYLLCILVGSVTGAVAAVMSVAGLAAQIGFLLLASAWFYSGLQAYLAVRQGRYDLHRVWMIRNYALTFAAVLLRVFLGLGLAAMDRGAPVGFADVYTSSVWASIFVSSLVAEWFVLRLGGQRAQPRPTPVVTPQGAPS